MAIASLILGIVSVVFSYVLICVPIVGQIIPLILGIVAIVLGAMSMKKFPEQKGMAIAGLILGIIGTISGLIMLITCGIVGAAANKAVGGIKNLSDEMEGLLEEAVEQLE